MNNSIEFFELTVANIAALGFAMVLEWLALSGLMRLMPHGQKPRRDPASANPGPGRRTHQEGPAEQVEPQGTPHVHNGNFRSRTKEQRPWYF